MEKIIKVLKDINKKENLIKDELKTNKNNSKNSNIINNILIREYPKFYNSNSTKDLIFNIFNELLQRASRKYSRTWKQLFENLDKLLKILYKNPLTLRGILSELRKSLKNERFEPLIYEESIKLMGMSIQESKNIAEKYKNEVQARNVNRGDLPVIYIEDIYNLLDQLIQSNNPYELSIAVEISTGARSIEVFKVSKFEEVEDHPNQIRVIGLAKDKNANNLENVVLVRNLVHLKANQVINAVNKIRYMLNTTGTNREISDRHNKQLNKAFKKYVKPLAEVNATEEQKETEQFKDYLKNLTSHKTRYLFGNISYLVYGKPKNIPFETYIQNQLGHLSGESTKSYLALNIKFKNKLIKNTTPEIKEYIKTVENQVHELKQNCCPPNTGMIDLTPFKNSFSRKESEDSKINKIIDVIQLYRDNNIKLPRQNELQKALGYGSNIMTKAYQIARQMGFINNFNIRVK